MPASSGAFVNAQGKVWDSTNQAWVSAWDGNKHEYLYKDGVINTSLTGGGWLDIYWI